MELNTLIQGQSYEEYDTQEGLRSGHLVEMSRSMAHYQYAITAPKKETDALSFGRMFHAALLEPDLFKSKMVVMPTFEGYTKDGKLSAQSKAAREMKAAWIAQLPSGAMIVKPDERDKMIGMLEALIAHPMVKKLMIDASREVSYFWDEEGTRQKCRFDFVTKDGMPFDLKTTTDAHPDTFSREIFNDRYKYYLRFAHYAAGAKASKVMAHDAFGVIAIEKAPPYGICVKTLNRYALAPGYAIRKKCLVQYKKCLEENKWPGYGVEATPANPPTWAFPEEFEG